MNSNENFVEKRNINKTNCLIYIKYLKNEYEYCPICGCKNDNTIIKNGTKVSLIKIPKVSELTSYLELIKQRYKRKNCKKKDLLHLQISLIIDVTLVIILNIL